MTSRKLQVFLLLIISLITFVANNGVMEANIMEARNLTTAREMLQDHNWFEPTMNGELRLEKPPLPTWIAAATMYIFGDKLWLLRLPSALAGFLMIFFLFKLTESFTQDRLLPFLSAATAATSFYILFMSRDMSWDIFCHSFMMGAIWMFDSGLKRKRHALAQMTGAGLFMGLSFLSKGPVSFYALLLPYLIARSFCFGWKEMKGKQISLLVMGLITLGISIWWPLLIWFSHPGLAATIVHDESMSWFTHDTRPFYHYWSFPVQSGIWALFATMALSYPYARERINRYANYTFLFTWVISAVGLLSLFPEKKERYLLPVLIPLAILTASYFRYLIQAFKDSTCNKTDRIIFDFSTFFMILICLGIPVSLLFLPFTGSRPDTGSLILLFILFGAVATLLVGSLLKRKPMLMWIGVVSIVLVFCSTVIPSANHLMITNPNYHSYRELRSRVDLDGIPFFFNGELHGKFIEVIYTSGHKINGWNPSVQHELPATPPLLLLSNADPMEVLPEDIVKNYHIHVIGHFDGNMGKGGEKNVLSNYATLIY